MQKLLFSLLFTSTLCRSAEEPKIISPGIMDYNELTPEGWSGTSAPILRCPIPAYIDWEDKYGWRMLTLKQGNRDVLYLDMIDGRINDILIDEAGQLAIVSLQTDTAHIIPYIASLSKKRHVWAADMQKVYDTIGHLSPENDPQDRYAISPTQLVGLRKKGDNPAIIEGLVRHASGINPAERGLSLLIYFTIDLNAPKPEEGKPWPLTITQVKDPGKELEWIPGNRDFDPPLAKPDPKSE